MPRLENPLQRVAVRAVEHHPFDLVGARRAHHPFGVGDLLGARLGRNEREVRNRRLASGEVDIRCTLECVAGSADGQCVAARLQPGCREAVLALAIAHDCHRNGRIDFPGADQDAFHRTLAIGDDLAAECGTLCLSPGGCCEARQTCQHGDRHPQRDQGPHGFLLHINERHITNGLPVDGFGRHSPRTRRRCALPLRGRHAMVVTMAGGSTHVASSPAEPLLYYETACPAHQPLDQAH